METALQKLKMKEKLAFGFGDLARLASRWADGIDLTLVFVSAGRERQPLAVRGPVGIG